MSLRTDSRRFDFVPGATNHPVIVGGSGCWLHTADGGRILDAAGGAIVANIGHGRPEVAGAVAAAMVGGGYVMPLWPTPHRLALLDRLVEHWLPEGFGDLFFTSGGTESTDSALRLARAYHYAKGRPERWKIVGRHPSYQGMTVGTLSVTSHSTRRAGFEPDVIAGERAWGAVMCPSAWSRRATRSPRCCKPPVASCSSPLAAAMPCAQAPRPCCDSSTRRIW